MTGEDDHDHTFGLDVQQAGEKRTHWVIALTLATMTVELTAGYLTGSMALTADGWHMSTHAAALGVAAFAYAFARKNAANRRFTFGTGKVASLGGFASAVGLALVALLMALESLDRLVHPIQVDFKPALVVATIGLAVNLVSAWLLMGDHDHHHGNGGEHHHHHDHNLRAAYLHVLADALTSITALVALTCGMFWGWVWLDPAMGIVGSVVIGVWSYGLLRDSGAVLLDAEDHGPRETEVRRLLEEAGGRITDLHIWRVGRGHYACIVSLASDNQDAPGVYKAKLETLSELAHVTVEVNPR